MGLLSAGVRWVGRAPRRRMGREVAGYFRDRSDGPVAVGAAELAPLWHSMPQDMGLMAGGGIAGIMALNRLALMERAPTAEQREERRLLGEMLAELRRAQRTQRAREQGAALGMQWATDDLADDVSRMNEVSYMDALTQAPPDRLYPPRRQYAGR